MHSVLPLRYVLLTLLFSMVLSGCSGNSSSSSTPTSQQSDNTDSDNDGGDNNNDNSNTGDNSNNDSSGGDGSNNSGDNSNNDNGNNDNGNNDNSTVTPPTTGSNCHYTTPTLPSLNESFSAALNDNTYIINSNRERTDLNNNLYGTWEMVHKNTVSNTTTRNHSVSNDDYKAVFVIHDPGQNTGSDTFYDIALCSSAGFLTRQSNLKPGDTLALPILSGSSALTMRIESYSRMKGVAPDASTIAIKISNSQTPLGNISATYNGHSLTDTNAWCAALERHLSYTQSCGSSSQPGEFTTLNRASGLIVSTREISTEITTNALDNSEVLRVTNSAGRSFFSAPGVASITGHSYSVTTTNPNVTVTATGSDTTSINISYPISITISNLNTLLPTN